MLTDEENKIYDKKCAKLFAEFEELNSKQLQLFSLYLHAKEDADAKHQEFYSILNEWKEMKK